MSDQLRKNSRLKATIIIVSVFLFLESLSGLIIFAAHKFKGTPKRISVFRFHPLITGENIHQYELNWAETFPHFGFTNRIHVSDECTYTTDRHGFIHNGDKSRTISPEDFTIFILGGSTVAGYGSSCNDQTISAHLEQLLRRKYKNISVINAGVAGYYSPLEFSKTANEIMFYDPDIIISFGGTNDFVFNYKTYKDRPHTYYVSDYLKQLYATLEQTRSLGWSIKNLIYNILKYTEYTYTRFVIEKGISYLRGRTRSSSQSSVIDNVKANVGPMKAKQGGKVTDDGFTEVLEQKLLYYSYYIKETHALVTGMGKKYFYVLQPILVTETRRLPPLEQEAREIVNKAYQVKKGMDIEKRAKFFWDQMDQIMKTTKVPYYNFTSIFPDETEIYSDQEHYNDLGNLIIARKLYEMLEKNRAIPPKLRQ